MKRFKLLLLSISLAAVLAATGQNPIIRDQFSADPSARLFNGKVYLFPSHDILGKPGQGRPNWFCMEDYHLFSSSDLTNWRDHGVIVSQEKVPWANPKGYSMWAPDCIYRNGKYYFYFPATAKDTTKRGFAIGVAIAEQPEGPYVPQPEPIANVRGIDPNVFIDKDGQAYLYWSMGEIFVAKLKESMLELDGEPQVVKELPQKGLKEGSWMFERNGIYYMTYPHVENKIERLEYAIGDNPLGPFKFTGVIMDESPMGCWTNHHSFLEYGGQWYLFYHQNAYSPHFDKNRAVCIDSLFFNPDGTIRKVIPTWRGVGVTPATQRIDIDRFSQVSETGTSLAFIDSLDTFKGWKVKLEGPKTWIKYNSVDFGRKKLPGLQLMASSKEGAVVEVRTDGAEGPLLGEVRVPPGGTWSVIPSTLTRQAKGVSHLVLVNRSGNPVEIDWITFGRK